MMREAARRGHELHVLQQEDLAWRDGGVGAATQRLHLTGDNDAWYPARCRAERAARGFRRGADAQGPAVRHGVRLQHLPAGTGAAPGRARIQRSARDPRLQRKNDHRALSAVHRADAGHARPRADPRLSRRAWRHHLEAARRHGRHLRVSRRTARTRTSTSSSKPSRITAAAPSWRSATFRRSPTATSACC